MYKIGDYIYDSDRLIVYKDDVSKEEIEIINDIVEKDDVDKAARTGLMSLNADEMSMDKITINEIGICLTYNCNLRCTYCGFSSTNENEDTLKISDVEACIKDIILKYTIKKLITGKSDPLHVYFTGGGEPTYNWKLFQETVLLIKRQCIRNNVPVEIQMTTNGMLTDEQIDFISHNFDGLTVSYDGIESTHNRNRVSPTCRNTNLIVEHTIEEIARRGVPLTIRTTIWQQDYCRMKEMYHHIFSLVSKEDDVDWSIYPTLFEGRAREHINGKEEMTYKGFLRNYIDLIEYVILEEGERRAKAISASILNNNISKIFCGAYKKENLWLLPNKKIVTCIEPKDEMVCVGEISNGKVKYQAKYQDKLLKIAQTKYLECRECIAYRFCKGGCPVWHLRDSSKHYQAPECLLQKEYWEYILEAVVSGKYSFGWQVEKMDIPDVQHDVYKLIHE